MNTYHNTITKPIEFAGFLRRFAAVALDAVLFSIVVAAFAFTYFDGYLPWSEYQLFDFREFLNHEILPFVLTVLFWVYKAATPGKMALNSQIIDAKTGEKPSVGQSIVRYLCYYVSALPLGLGFFWALFDKHNRAWHDLIAGTLVVKSA